MSKASQGHKKPPQKAAPASRGPSPAGWALILAGLFILVIAGGVGLSLLAERAATRERPAPPTATPSWMRLAPTPTVVALKRSVPGDPSSPLTTVSPAGDVPTPPPNWDALYASLGAPAGGSELLILCTNDTWGYLRPCG